MKNLYKALAGMAIAVSAAVLYFNDSEKYVQVSTYEEFAKALNTKKEDLVIELTDTIDFTNKEPLTVYGNGTRVYSTQNRGVIRSESFLPEKNNTAVLLLAGSNVTVDGVQFFGPARQMYDQVFHSTNGLSWCAIKNSGKNQRIANCSFNYCDKWALWFFVLGNSYVENCDFYHVLATGYGYGIWAGGSGAERDGNLKIVGCRFDKYRVAIDASGSENNVYIYDCYFGSQCYYTVVQRHDKSIARTWGGKNFVVENCVFMSGINQLNLPKPSDSAGVVQITGNVFQVDSCKENIPSGSEWCTWEPHPRVKWSNNRFLSKDEDLPKVTIEASGSQTYANKRVDFWIDEFTPSSKKSEIKSVTWDFGELGEEDRITTESPKASHAFSQHGVYDVRAFVVTQDGAMSRTAVKRIVVDGSPNAVAHIMCSNTRLDTLYRLSITLDGNVIKELPLINFKEWTRLEIPLTESVKDGKNHYMSLRVESTREELDISKTEILVWVDQVFIPGASAIKPDWQLEPGLESVKIYPPWNGWYIGVKPGYSNWSVSCISGESLGGNRCMQIRIPYGGKVAKGQAFELYHYFKM